MASAAPPVLAGAVFVLAAALSLTPFDSHDLWWHLRTGELIWRTGQVPTTNTFSFTAPHQAWVTHEWLSEVLFFLAYRYLQPAALLVLKALVVGFAFTLVYWTARRESGNAWLAAAAAAAAAHASRFVFDVRPHLFTLLALAALLEILSRYRRRGGRIVYGLVPLFLVWANLHSGFIVGVAVLALAAVLLPAAAIAPAEDGPDRGQARHLPTSRTSLQHPLDLRLCLVWVLCAGACFATPNHWRGVWFPLQVSRTALFTQTLTEWFSPDFHSPWLQSFEVQLLVTLVLFAISPVRARPFEWLLLIGVAHMALQHQRHAALFCVAAAPVLARHAAPLVAPLRRLAQVPVWVETSAASAWLLASGVLLLAATPGSDPFGSVVGRASFPEVAAAELSRRPPARIYNSYVWGGYLIWAWRDRPGHRVFIDGRADAYPQQVFQDYLSIERLEPTWETLLNRYRVDVVLYHAGRPLCLMLRRHPDWELVYADSVAEVFVRRLSRDWWHGAHASPRWAGPEGGGRLASSRIAVEP